MHYRVELIRLIAQMSLGTGALASSAALSSIVGFLTLSTGALIAVQGYNRVLRGRRRGADGFVSAYFNVRLVAPVTAGIALAATIGAGATAQLGAMRINEEIDALEVMGIRSVAYLASTRVLAGVIVVIPLYCIAVLMAFLAARLGTTMLYGQSTGVYDHYFNTFLNPSRSALVVRADDRDGRGRSCWCTPTTATPLPADRPGSERRSGGPCGRRWSSQCSCCLFVSLAIYGQSGNFHLAG